MNITFRLVKINGFRKHSFVRERYEVLNQTLNIHIQNHLVEGSSKKMKS